MNLTRLKRSCLINFFKDEEKPIVVIQGAGKSNKAFVVGDRVSIIYGAQVRALPSNN